MYVVRLPSSKRKVTNRDVDAELAVILSKTEIMIAGFHQKARLSQRFGQALLDLLKHPQFNLADIKSENIVHLIRRLEYLRNRRGLEYKPEEERDINSFLGTYLVQDNDKCDIFTFGGIAIRSVNRLRYFDVAEARTH